MNASLGKLAKSPAVRLVSRILLLLLFLALRVYTAPGLLTPDESIAWSVARAMVDRGDLNGNWRLAPDILPAFRVDMMNFYSYNLLAAAVLRSTREDTVVLLRLLNVLLQLGALGLICSALRRCGIPYWRVFLVALAITLLPTMVMDAHIARTESLLYFLLAVLIYIAATRGAGVWSMMAFGTVLGFGAASKITFLLAGLILVPALLNNLRETANGAVRNVAVLFLAIGIGFAIGAPYAVVEPQTYLAGLKSLGQQYSGSQPPHSDAGSMPWDWALKLAEFTFLITGGSAILGLRLAGNHAAWILGISLMSLSTLLLFCGQPVFFERNISLALLGMVVVAFLCTRRGYAIIFLVFSLFVMGYFSVNVAWMVRNSTNVERRAWERQTLGPRAIQYAWPDPGDMRKTLDQCPDILGLPEYGDAKSKHLRSVMLSEPIAIWKSPFHVLPPSTFQMYLGPDVIYYNCNTEGR